jgi:hypothetical protein
MFSRPPLPHLHTVEVVGSNPAVPTNPFNNLGGMTVEAFAAFCGKSSEDVFSPPFVSIKYTDPTISCTLSGSSCMYSLAVVSGRECRKCAWMSFTDPIFCAWVAIVRRITLEV